MCIRLYIERICFCMCFNFVCPFLLSSTLSLNALPYASGCLLLLAYKPRGSTILCAKNLCPYLHQNACNIKIIYTKNELSHSIIVWLLITDILEAGLFVWLGHCKYSRKYVHIICTTVPIRVVRSTEIRGDIHNNTAKMCIYTYR